MQCLLRVAVILPAWSTGFSKHEIFIYPSQLRLVMHLIFDLTPFAHPVGILVRAVNSVKSYFYTLIIGNVMYGNYYEWLYMLKLRWHHQVANSIAILSKSWILSRYSLKRSRWWNTVYSDCYSKGWLTSEKHRNVFC